MNTLLLLIIITQTQLLQEIWGPTHQEDSHYLRIIVSHLRQKLGEDPPNPSISKLKLVLAIV